ncbi:MAG: hypothetical protein R3B06_16745 [Kofleriaceae bacterium]
MIPYPELAAALDRWRVRHGLPITEAPPAPPASVDHLLTATSYGAPAAVATPAPVDVGFAAPPPRTVPPAPPAAPPAAITLDEELDADMLEAADVYDNEGSDFAVSFGGPPAAASGSIGDDVLDESTHIGAAVITDPFGAAPTAAVPPPSQWPEAKDWPAEATAATNFGWGQSHRPSTDGEDEATTAGPGDKPHE